MDVTIKFKAFFLKKALIWLAVIGVPLSFFIFLLIKIGFIYLYFLSMFIVFVGLLIVFYLNKYDLESIKIQGEHIEFKFFNKAFFKRKPYECRKQAITSRLKEDIIELHKDKKMIVKIRSSAASEKDWVRLKTYFDL
jgi:type IV secretory pathway VirB3-like protein